MNCKIITYYRMKKKTLSVGCIVSGRTCPTVSITNHTFHLISYLLSFDVKLKYNIGNRNVCMMNAECDKILYLGKQALQTLAIQNIVINIDASIISTAVAMHHTYSITIFFYVPGHVH